MKAIYPLLMVFISLYCLPTLASGDSGTGLNDYSFEPELLPSTLETEEGTAQPFSIRAGADSVAETNFDNSKLKGHKFSYLQEITAASYIFYYEHCYKEGVYGQIGYEIDRLNWTGNPYFSDKWFHTVHFSVGGFTNRVEGWKWMGMFSLNLDTEGDNWSDYTNYDVFLWGRYTYQEDIGIHLGLYVQTGMKIDRVYPIIGADWEINDDWKLNAVFPMNVSLVYNLASHWSTALAARFFDTRHRLRKHEPLSMGLWCYRSVGTEFAINYFDDLMRFNLHAGYDMAATLKIATRHYHNKKRYNLENAPYVGGELELKF